MGWGRVFWLKEIIGVTGWRRFGYMVWGRGWKGVFERRSRVGGD